jgi:hypothetical protein
MSHLVPFDPARYYRWQPPIRVVMLLIGSRRTSVASPAIDSTATSRLHSEPAKWSFSEPSKL